MIFQPLATDAMSDLIELVSVSNGNSDCANAFEEFCQLGLPVITCHIDGIATGWAGDGGVSFQVSEALVRHMAAALAG